MPVNKMTIYHSLIWVFLNVLSEKNKYSKTVKSTFKNTYNLLFNHVFYLCTGILAKYIEFAFISLLILRLSFFNVLLFKSLGYFFKSCYMAEKHSEVLLGSLIEDSGF